MELLAAKVAPSTLAERAHEAAVLAGHIESVLRGLPLAPVDYTPVLLERMTESETATPIEDEIAAFQGFTYAWMVAMMPHLFTVLTFTGPEFKPRVDLGMGVGFDLPQAFRYADEDWRAS